MTGPGAPEAAKRWAAEVADLITRHGGGNRRLAVDRLDAAGFLALQQLSVDTVDGQELVEQARVLKTPQELLAVRESIAACQSAVLEMGAALAPGMTERELWSRLHQHSIALGGEWIETRLLTSGPRTNPWYQECSDRVIEAGDLVAFDTDLVGRYGYCCDISRTWRAGGGQASDAQRRTYAGAFAHLQRLLDLIGPGLTLAELAAAIGEPPSGHHVYSCLAHGIGMCDEYPVAFWAHQKESYDAALLPGMTICVESYLGPDDGGEGVKLEEQILITEDGIEVLSTLPFEEGWL
jgi:Xaa-Pro aminopeptidase